MIVKNTDVTAVSLYILLLSCHLVSLFACRSIGKAICLLSSMSLPWSVRRVSTTSSQVLASRYTPRRKRNNGHGGAMLGHSGVIIQHGPVCWSISWGSGRVHVRVFLAFFCPNKGPLVGESAVPNINPLFWGIWYVIFPGSRPKNVSRNPKITRRYGF